MRDNTTALLARDPVIDRVLECWLSHEWTPDTWEDAHKEGLVPKSWVESNETT